LDDGCGGGFAEKRSSVSDEDEEKGQCESEEASDAIGENADGDEGFPFGMHLTGVGNSEGVSTGATWKAERVE
jgi:hypothetical protein